MIIIEGPNGSGKSVLAEKLARDLNFTIHKFMKIPQTIDEFNDQSKISMELIGKEVVQDRCPMISDWVYAPHNANRAPYMTIGQVKGMLSDLRPTTIFCETDKLNPKNRSYPSQLLKLIRFTYLDFFKFLDTPIALNIPLFRYDYTKTNYDYFLESLPFAKRCHAKVNEIAVAHKTEIIE